MTPGTSPEAIAAQTETATPWTYPAPTCRIHGNFHPCAWGCHAPTINELSRSLAQLLAALEASERERERLRERERSIYAWAKAARDKESGLPPSRALRWIDEMGDRIAAAALAPSTPPDLREDA